MLNRTQVAEMIGVSTDNFYKIRNKNKFPKPDKIVSSGKQHPTPLWKKETVNRYLKEQRMKKSGGKLDNHYDFVFKNMVKIAG